MRDCWESNDRYRSSELEVHTHANHIERNIALQATGAATTSRYSRGLLRFLGRYGLRGVDPTPLAIK